MPSEEVYASTFYEDRHRRTVTAARRILDRALEVLPPVRSTVDVGCGVGTWLVELQRREITNVHGYEGDWVDTQQLAIATECFSHHDLTTPIPAPAAKYDLALSLEVAEHLPESAADTFVGSLTGLSDFVLFSAAIPGQGGRHHINEQWIEYWLALFERRDYVGLDVIRDHIWHDREIDTWYKQNVILVAARSRLEELNLPASPDVLKPRSLVHPACFTYWLDRYGREIEKHRSLGGSWKLFRRAVRSRFTG